MSQAEKFVNLNTYNARFEAEVVKSFLESEGFEVQVIGDDLGGIGPHLSFSRGVSLRVKQKDFMRASRILEQLSEAQQRIEKEDEESAAQWVGEKKRFIQVTGHSIFGLDIVWWIALMFVGLQIVLYTLDP